MLELRLQYRLRLGLARTGPRTGRGPGHGPRLARGLALAGLLASIALVALAGCGQGGSGGDAGGGGDPSPAPLASAAGTVAQVTAAATTSTGANRKRLVYSSASATVVQPQPAPGSCHAIGSGLYSRPDPHCTPGALNPAVTQATIGRTICRSGWTKTVRPPARITDREKLRSMAAYGDTGSAREYEYDHFVSLELGGAVNDARNLWPEPGASPNSKDSVEDELHRQVCDGQMTLAQAQRAIAINWVALTKRSSPPNSSPPGSAPNANCTISASYSSRYHDYNVYVRSNQPDTTVVVTDAAGHTFALAHERLGLRRRLPACTVRRGRRERHRARRWRRVPRIALDPAHGGAGDD